jgi:hypothetical protein
MNYLKRLPSKDKIPRLSNSTTTTTNTTKEVDYHLVFSTGCSLFQDWQSYAFFYHVQKSGQPGNVTRIVSGCTQTQKQELRQAHETQIRTISPRFHIHFTPDYSNVKPDTHYIYFNKPFGTKHWMEHVLGYDNYYLRTNNSTKRHDEPIDDTIIILLDPDQLILKPLTHDYTNLNMKWMHRRNTKLPKMVQHKQTMAQRYAYGNEWITQVDLEHLLPHDVARKASPLWKLSSKTASRFAAGPPYLATARDMYTIVQTWVDFVPRVHEDYPQLLAEMFAYNLAAHHVHRRPLTSPGFMVSNVAAEGGKEGWYWIEEQQEIGAPTFCSQQYPVRNASHHPFLLHYCGVYDWGNVSFLKYYMNHTFLSCGADLLQEPENHPITDTSSQIRDAYMMCALIPALNDAVTHYKQQHCPQDPSTTSYQKIQKLQKYDPKDIKTWNPNN